MKNFVIAWVSFHDNELHQKRISAKDLHSAEKLAFMLLTDVAYDSEFDPNIYQAAFDCDGMISAIEI